MIALYLLINMDKMGKINEVIVFTNGDSSKLSTWSNVPFFFTETLISKGIKVHRVNLSPRRSLQVKFEKSILKLITKILKNTSYDYYRSFVHFLDVRFRIRKSIAKYPEADVCIFLTFSFSAVGLTEKPSVLFCDWTYDHYFRYFLRRKPDFFERFCIKREDKMIRKSNAVFPLFPSIANYMKSRYANKNLYYLGNVINALYKPDKTVVLKKKSHSRELLFIGSRKYIDGAKSLIRAFQEISTTIQDLSLNIIGMNTNDFESLPTNVHCYGYLDKGNQRERETYYNLLESASIFVNTSPKWGAFSACVEAMYFYNPVVVTPYEEFTKTFGAEINFGAYCEQNDANILKSNILKILHSQNYELMCTYAHESVKDFTWDVYIGKLIDVVECKDL